MGPTTRPEWDVMYSLRLSSVFVSKSTSALLRSIHTALDQEDPKFNECLSLFWVVRRVKTILRSDSNTSSDSETLPRRKELGFL